MMLDLYTPSILLYTNCLLFSVAEQFFIIQTYDCRYEEIGDVLDDTLPTPLLNDNLSELEQDTILEI